MNKLAFGIHITGMFDTLCPGDVRYVYQTIDAFFDADKHAEVGHVLDLAFDFCADGVLVGNRGPWVFGDLLETEGDLAVAHVDTEYHCFNLFTDSQNVGSAANTLGPGHLGHMDQAFNTCFQLNKGAVFHQADNLALDACLSWLFCAEVNPWFGNRLLIAT